MAQINRPVIKKIIDDIKEKSFVSGYQASDSEAMGLFLSNYFGWDGVQILETAMYATEDANFHGESAQISEMINKITKGAK